MTPGRTGDGPDEPRDGRPEPVDEATSGAERLDDLDLAVLARVRSLFEARDPVPEGLAERIEFALTLDALETEVATLTQVDLATAGSRAGETETVRTVTFSTETLDAMVTLTDAPDGTVRVDGWIAPGAAMRVELVVAGSTLEVESDEDGRFVLEAVPKGLAKFALHPGGRTVVSPTIEL